MWSLCRNHYTSNRYQGGLQLDLIKIFLKLKAIFVKENLRFKTLIYISFSYIKSLSDFIIMVRVGEDQEILTLEHL